MNYGLKFSETLVYNTYFSINFLFSPEVNENIIKGYILSGIKSCFFFLLKNAEAMQMKLSCPNKNKLATVGIDLRSPNCQIDDKNGYIKKIIPRSYTEQNQTEQTFIFSIQ